jgi:RNA ligase
MIQELRYLESEGLVRCNPHRELPLLVWNYTPIVQFGKSWGDYPLLRQCRGLITDLNGAIVGRGFAKFFNWEEHTISELPIGDSNLEVTEKMDGSLLIVCRYGDTVVYSTRGSFYSDQAIAGGKLFQSLYNEDWIEAGKTYLFEYISPENRIVVSYDEPDLIHLAVIDNSNGWDLPRDTRYKCVKVVHIEGNVCDDVLAGPYKLKSLNSPNKEGFVIRQVSDGTFPDWRCKIKFDDYIKLHRIVTGVSNKTVWEMLRDGTSIELMLEICPDEFNDWLRKVKTELENKFSLIETSAQKVYSEVKEMSTRKDQALHITANYHTICGVIFAMLDNKDYKKVIWNLCKPDKYEQPFEGKGED